MGCLYAILAGVVASLATFFAGDALARFLVIITHEEVYGFVPLIPTLIAWPIIATFAMIGHAARVPTWMAERKASRPGRAHGFPVIMPPEDTEESK